MIDVIHKKPRTNWARPPIKVVCGRKIKILGYNYHYWWSKVTCKDCLKKRSKR